MEEDPDVVPGGDEGGRDGRATEPEGLLAGRGCGAQHEPVQGALVGLLHVKVAEAAGGREDRRCEWVVRDQQVMPKLTARMASPSIPSLFHSQLLNRPPGVQEWLHEESGQCGQLGTCQPPGSSPLYLSTLHQNIYGAPTEGHMEWRQESHDRQVPPLTLSPEGQGPRVQTPPCWLCCHRPGVNPRPGHGGDPCAQGRPGLGDCSSPGEKHWPRLWVSRAEEYSRSGREGWRL